MAIVLNNDLHESDIAFEYEVAIDENNTRRLRTLIKHDLALPKNCLYQAVRCKHKNLIPILLDAGADPNQVVNRSWTILGESVLKEDVPTLKLVLSYGANPNQYYLGLPPLLLAARLGNVEILRLLIRAGGSLFDHPRLAPEAMFEAVGRGHKETVKFLVEQGVQFASRKPFGKTAIEYADQHGITEIGDYLRACRSKRRSATHMSAPKKK